MNRNSVAVDSPAAVGRLTMKWLLRLFVCFLSVSFSLAARGQVGAGSLSGIVEDQTSAVVAGATVTLHNTESGADRMVRSSGLGGFVFSAVPSGDYNVTVEMSGFKRFVRPAVHLNPGDALALPEIKLGIETANTTV